VEKEKFLTLSGLELWKGVEKVYGNRRVRSKKEIREENREGIRKGIEWG
jgi:hypothetical protein